MRPPWRSIRLMRGRISCLTRRSGACFIPDWSCKSLLWFSQCRSFESQGPSCFTGAQKYARRRYILSTSPHSQSEYASESVAPRVIAMDTRDEPESATITSYFADLLAVSGQTSLALFVRQSNHAAARCHAPPMSTSLLADRRKSGVVTTRLVRPKI